MQIAQLVATSGADLMSMLPFLQVEAAQTAEIAGAEDFSVMSLIIRAGPVVKAVMAILLVMSVWSWAIAFDKWFGVGAARSKAKAFEKAFWSGQPLDEMDDRVSSRPSEALARVFSAGSREWRDSRRIKDLSVSEGDAMMDRARTQMGVAISRESARLEGGLSTLAIIGSSAPFVGLFGTVWGIMNSFRSIAAAQESNLAVVAPGIAEALFATALGLFAAIPAVIFYNKFSSDVGKFSEHMDTFADEFAVRLSRRINDRMDG
ncbi:MAG: protein TolQ [Hirschia sp.]|nr:protein TolQ [Hirschia sp.]MBF19367.1 protein TolQ [Hirschia sp.]